MHPLSLSPFLLYSTFLVIDEEAIVHFILPGLQNIQGEAEPSYKHMLDSMINDMQTAIRHDDPKAKHEDTNTFNTLNASNLMGKAFSKVSSGWAMPSMSVPGIPGRKKEDGPPQIHKGP